MAFFILTRFVLVKYSRAFVERPSQGTSSLASRLTTVSLDVCMHLWIVYTILGVRKHTCIYTILYACIHACA